MDQKRKRLDTDLRARLVWEAMWRANRTLTMEGIAEESGLTRSPYLRQIVDTLYAHNCINKGLDVSEQGRAVIVYWVTNDPASLT